jgi:hypothetical protein
MKRSCKMSAAWAAIAMLIVAATAPAASAAGRWRQTYGASVGAQRTATTANYSAGGNRPGPLGLGNGFNSGNSASGWNRNNSWYNFPQYGNYAPPPYATSRSSLIQIGPMPAFGGVRSLQGWGGAR